MGVGRQDLAEPRVGRKRVRATLSLSAGKARTPSGASRAGAVISRVKSAPGAISYVGVSYLTRVTNASEDEAALGNSSGNFVLPTSRAIQAALASTGAMRPRWAA
jgi:ABC-type phosphate transport system substrate-binding protein